MQIGELARTTSTKVETIRFYEKIGLLPKPSRTSGNYRDYGSDHLARLSFVRRARGLGFRLDQVRELLPLSLTIRIVRAVRLTSSHGHISHGSTRKSPTFARCATNSTS